MKKTIFIASLFLLTTSIGCDSSSSEQNNTEEGNEQTKDNNENQPTDNLVETPVINSGQDQQITKYLAEKGINAKKQASGLYVFVEEEGSTEKPATSDYVTLFYKGYTLDGTVFDGTESDPVNFPLFSLIPGWQEGIPHFGKGGKGKLIIPSNLAYGDRQSGDIAPNSVLVFDIEVVDFSPRPKIQKTGDFSPEIKKYIAKNNIKGMKETESGLFISIENEGTGEKVKITDFLTLTYSGYLLNGEKFDGKDEPTAFPFPVSQLIPGWQEGIPMLGKGGKAKLIIPPYLGYGEHAQGPIPANSVLVFDIEIFDYSDQPKQ